jgi:hypothetical protein
MTPKITYEEDKCLFIKNYFLNTELTGFPTKNPGPDPIEHCRKNKNIQKNRQQSERGARSEPEHENTRVEHQFPP